MNHLIVSKLHPRAGRLARLLLTWLVLFAAPSAQSTDFRLDLISQGTPGDTAAGGSDQGMLASIDGRVVLFQSTAGNLIAQQRDSNGESDVFVHDRLAHTTTLLSGALGSDRTTADGSSWPKAITPDGRWVLIGSTATNLVAGITDGNNGADVYLLDRSNGQRVLVSHAVGATMTSANGASYPVDLSADGRWVLLHSFASDVDQTAGDNRYFLSTYLFDRTTGASHLLAHAAGAPGTFAQGGAEGIALSDDGRWALLASTAQNLVNGQIDQNTSTDLFLYDRDTDSVRLVTRAHGTAATTANDFSLARGLSADGRWVLLISGATNLVDGLVDANDAVDVFLFDRDSGSMTLVSHAAGAAATTANRGAGAMALSPDGRWSLYASAATNLITGLADGNDGNDVFLFDRDSQQSILVSRAADASLATANGASTPIGLSADGQRVLFHSEGTNLRPGVVDANGAADAYLFERSTGTSLLVSRAANAGKATANAAALPLALSADGSAVLLASQATDVVEGAADTNAAADLFLFDPSSGVSTLLSNTGARSPISANGQANASVLSADGRWVLYGTAATDVRGVQVLDRNGADDTYLLDRETGTTVLAGRAAGAAGRTPDGSTTPAALSADGRWVLLNTTATNLVAGVSDANEGGDVYLFDRDSGTAVLVSRAPGAGLATANLPSRGTALSADGRWALFFSQGDNFVPDDTNGNADVFLFDRDTGSISLVSGVPGMPGRTGNDGSAPWALSPDGRWVLYYSFANDLIAGGNDGNDTVDAFLFDRTTGSTVLVTRAHGMATTTPNGRSYPTAMSADGRWVLYYSWATDVTAASDNNGVHGRDVFLFDRVSQTTLLVSRAGGSPAMTANGESVSNDLSADGRWVLFDSTANNLINGVTDTNAARDLFLFDRETQVATLVTRALGSASVTPNGQSYAGSLSADGSHVVFASSGRNLVSGVAFPQDTSNCFAFDRATATTDLLSKAVEPSGAAANRDCTPIDASTDGAVTLLVTRSSNLAPGVADGNLAADVVVAVLQDGLFANGFE